LSSRFNGLNSIFNFTDLPIRVLLYLGSIAFGALTSLGFGIVGQYLWLALPGSHRRPEYIIRCAEEHGPSRTQATGNDDPR
jgi:hypothetical protein